MGLHALFIQEATDGFHGGRIPGNHGLRRAVNAGNRKAVRRAER